ncbi:hypothetical protein B0H13DRAFT_2300432 [Mycena leptocephala]|nr:hypothetical protein B0H13DRAFT_2300432 [Mycena leptocephala]
MLRGVSFVLAALLVLPHLAATVSINASDAILANATILSNGTILANATLLANHTPSNKAHHPKKPANVCSLLTSQAARSLEGVVQYVRDWDWFGPPAYACLGSGPFMILAGTARCSEETFQSEGVFVNTTGEVTLSYKSGFPTSATMTTTKSSALSVGVSVSVSLGIPVVGEGTTEVTTTYTVQNTVGSSFTTTVEKKSSHSVTLHAPKNSKCFLKYRVSQCTAAGTAHVSFVANGGFAASDHRDLWRATIFRFVGVPGSTSNMELEGSLSSDSSSEFHGECVPIL